MLVWPIMNKVHPLKLRSLWSLCSVSVSQGVLCWSSSFVWWVADMAVATHFFYVVSWAIEVCRLLALSQLDCTSVLSSARFQNWLHFSWNYWVEAWLIQLMRVNVGRNGNIVVCSSGLWFSCQHRPLVYITFLWRYQRETMVSRRIFNAI